MEESYENLKADHNQIIKEFKILDNQSGVLIIVNGEIKGFELFLNPEIYREYHEKILKSYLIDSKIENAQFSINIDSAKEVIDQACASTFTKRENNGLEKGYEFENDNGLGTLYSFKNQIIHWSYFKKDGRKNDEDFIEDITLKSDI